MPFIQQIPRTFTKENIEAIKPGVMGVYGLFVDGGGWVYVGRGDIRDRLLAHLNGDNPCITRSKPTHYVDEITATHEAREKALITELNPPCNKKVG